jgi:hypothetical protein
LLGFFSPGARRRSCGFPSDSGAGRSRGPP